MHDQAGGLFGGVAHDGGGGAESGAPGGVDRVESGVLRVGQETDGCDAVIFATFDGGRAEGGEFGDGFDPMKARKLKFGSVCSGIEAASAAWHPLGWECLFVAEIEGFPSTLLKVKYPQVSNYGDMTKYEEWPKHAIDVLVGGTPCQSFSVAGLRKGLADPRGNLALTFLGKGDKGDGGVNTTMVAEITTLDAKNRFDRGDSQHLERRVVQGVPHVPAISNAICSRDYKGARPEADQYMRPKGRLGPPQDEHPIAFPSTLSATQRVRSENVSAAIGASNAMGVAHEMAVRRLTPRECERLQGFPDDYTLVLNRGKAAADGPRYKALGNSMAVPVMRWIGERILLVEGLAAKGRKERKGVKV